MSDILICPWTPEHGRMQPAEGVYVRCSKCSAWARTVSAASVIRAIETIEAEMDRLREGWAELDNAVARDVARYFKADPTNTRFDECRAIFRVSLAVTGQGIRNEPEPIPARKPRPFRPRVALKEPTS